MNYYLGVDAGGSKTYTLISNEHGQIVGKGHSGNGNHQLGAERARGNIAASVEMALASAGLQRGDIAHAFFGLAGADRPIDYEVLRPMIKGMGFARYGIDCDTMIALRAGTREPYGVVLICGSGTNSAGRNRAGDFYQCGGFTYTFGDFGGGGTLAVEAFRSVIRAWDGREQQTLLTELVLRALGYPTVQAMFDDFLDHEKQVPLHLTKLLFEAAKQNDETAQRILRVQGEELGRAATAVIRRLGMQEDAFDVVLAGSVVTRGEGDHVQAYIEEAVRQAAPQAHIVRLQVEPVVGAVFLAMEAEGGQLSEAAYAQLSRVSDYEQILTLTTTSEDVTS